MKKGVIMEIDSKYLTLLTQEGEFLKAKNLNKNYEIGEEISFYPSSDFSAHKLKFFERNKLRLMVASSLAIMLVFLTFFPYHLNNQVYAYMSIDINPSIELGVNRHLKVISMEALNDDGREIIKEIDKWKKKNIEKVTKSIISEFKQDGYIKEDKTILITTTIVNENDNQETKKDLEQKVEQITTNYKEKDINIEAVTAKTEEREKAKAKGVSTGQLLKIENKLPNQNQNNKPNQKVKQKIENNGILQKKENQKPFTEKKQIKQNEKVHLEQRNFKNHRQERNDQKKINENRKNGPDFKDRENRDWEHKKFDQNRKMKQEHQIRQQNQNHQQNRHPNHDR